MPELDWGMIGTLITIIVTVAGVALLALDERNRKKFAPRESLFDASGDPKFVSRTDMSGFVARIDDRLDRKRREIERNAGLFVSLDDRVGDLEEKTALLEERQTLQWQRISEQMAATARSVDDATRRMEKISESQQSLALKLERLSRGSQ